MFLIFSTFGEPQLFFICQILLHLTLYIGLFKIHYGVSTKKIRLNCLFEKEASHLMGGTYIFSAGFPGIEALEEK